MPSCPHCSEEITKLSGFIAQADHEQRLAAKSGEIKRLSESLTAANAKAEAAAGLEERAAKAERELSQLKTHAERAAVAKAAGLDEALVDHLGDLFASAAADQPDLAFADWLGGAAKEHPLLRPHFVGTSAQPTGGAGAGTQQRAGAAAGAEPARPKQGSSADELRKVLASPEYRRLPVEKQRERLAELEAQYTQST